MSDGTDEIPERLAHVTEKVDKMLVGTIVMLGQEKEALAEVSSLYEMTYPRLAATPDQVEEAEQRVGFQFDDLHRRLLMFANGWYRMALSRHLLPTEAFGTPGLWQDSLDHLEIFFEEAGDDPRFADLHRAYPIATNDQTDDIFLVRHDGPLIDGGHEVIWFADDIVHVFSNVIDWMLAMKSDVATMRELEAKEADSSSNSE